MSKDEPVAGGLAPPQVIPDRPETIAPRKMANSKVTPMVKTSAKALWTVTALRATIDTRLAHLIPGPQTPPRRLHAAMSYALLSPGKRLRPVLTLLTSAHFGVDDLRALDCACAIEMIHAASLIMDDLPAMDDAELRRGQPTTHRKFGEDIAVLASTALLSRAFGVVADASVLAPEIRLELVRRLATAVGSDGLIGGQVMDLEERSPAIDRQRLERLNQLKTAALFVASVEAGAYAAGVRGEPIGRVRDFALQLGLAFQIADDMLDDPAFAGKTGKDTGKDSGKPTIVSILGPAGARRALEDHLNQARASLGAADGSSPLLAFVEASFEQFYV